MIVKVTMTLPVWWKNASEADQANLLAKVGYSINMAGVPWAFLPASVQAALLKRFQVKP